MARVTRSYRLRAYPNGAQRRMIDRWCGAVRWLWNTSLGIRSECLSRMPAVSYRR
ncbi:MAG: helix-turn-helix domain-containing protein [Steroidobacteraceae bacterium]